MTTAPTQTIPNLPALGAVLSRPDVQEARDRMRWVYAMSRADHVARWRAINDLARTFDDIRVGRRLDLVAADLLAVASRLEDVIQPVAGGWPCRVAA